MVKKFIGSAALTPSSDTGFDLTTKGDTHGYSNTNARIPISTNNFSLLCDSAESLGLKWAASPTSVLTGAMDILYSSSANTLARLGAGSDGKVLTTHSTSSAPTWETPSAGGGNWVLVGEATNSGSSCTLSISPAVAQSDIILLCAIFRGSTSAAGVGMDLTVNGDTSSNYSTVGSYTDGSSTTDFGTSGQGEWSLAMSGSSTQDTQIISYISCTVGSKITSQSTFSASNEVGMQTGYLNVGSSTSFDEIKFTDGNGGDLFDDSNLVVYKLTT